MSNEPIDLRPIDMCSYEDRGDRKCMERGAKVLTERVALDVFWGAMAADTRPLSWLALLRSYAHVRVRRGPTSRATRGRAAWSVQRAKERPSWDAGKKCLTCEAQATQQHHVISVANNGTNQSRNLVPLCRPCHLTVHPWMAKPMSPQRKAARRRERSLAKSRAWCRAYAKRKRIERQSCQAGKRLGGAV